MTAESAPDILESSNSAPPKVDKLKAAKGFIFDMDGVLYRGKQPLPGVQTLFDALTLRGIKFLLATNNSTALPSDYVKRMAEMNVTVTENDVQTSATATRDYLRDELPAGAKIYIVGMPALAHLMFDGTGFEQATDETPANEVTAVVAGLDFEFTYTKLRSAMAAIHAGAKFIATNADATLPHEGGFWPGSGSLIAAIATASGTQPIVVGKPEPLMMQKGIELLGLSADEVVMVGDRLDTDILAGYRAGTTTALVLTGVTTRDDLASATPLPDYVFADLPALTQEIVGHG